MLTFRSPLLSLKRDLTSWLALQRHKKQMVESVKLGRVQPSFAEIQVTNACQLNCVGCWYYGPFSPGKPTEWKRQVLDYEICKRTLLQLKEVGFTNLRFSGGGDPLAHPKIYQILEDASQYFEVTLLSNLLLCKEVQRLKKIKIKSVLINFSAGTPETYVKYHPNQSEKSFFDLLSLIKELRPHMKLELNFVLCALNCEEVEQMLQIAAETTGNAIFKTMRDAPVLMSESQRIDVQRNLKRYIRRADQLGLDHNLRTFSPYSDRVPFETIRCYAGYYTTVVQASGEVKVCCAPGADAMPLGNVNDTDFRNIWKSDQYEMLRKKFENREFESFCSGCNRFDRNKLFTEYFENLEASGR